MSDWGILAGLLSALSRVIPWLRAGPRLVATVKFGTEFLMNPVVVPGGGPQGRSVSKLTFDVENRGTPTELRQLVAILWKPHRFPFLRKNPKVDVSNALRTIRHPPLPARLERNQSWTADIELSAGMILDAAVFGSLHLGVRHAGSDKPCIVRVTLPKAEASHNERP